MCGFTGSKRSSTKRRMAERLVVNASPLILLGLVGRLELFIALADEVAIPEAVVQDGSGGSVGRPGLYLTDETAARALALVDE